MLNISLICVGKLKEKYYREAVDEYAKRLGRFCSLDIIEVKDEPTGSESEDRAALEKESARVLSKLPKGAYVISLCVEGTEMTSEAFAKKLDEFALGGVSHIAFIIGGSVGLHNDIKRMSGFRLSFSKMTLPHRLMRVVLVEQLYRAFTINNNITYHK